MESNGSFEGVRRAAGAIRVIEGGAKGICSEEEGLATKIAEWERERTGGGGGGGGIEDEGALEGIFH